MFCENPKIEGTPKCDNDEIIINSAPDEIAGLTSGNVILRITYPCEAPAIRADSSNVGSILSNALTTCMNTNGK